MKRTPLVRKTGLSRGAGLARSTGLKRTPLARSTLRSTRSTGLPVRSAKRQAQMDERAAVRQAVLERDRVCQLALAGEGSGFDVGRCWGRLEVHEVRKASQGGSYSEANGRAVCSHHNSQLEADADLAAFARSVGLVRRRGD